MKKIFLALLICIGILSCKKNEVENKSGFVIPVNSDFDYAARNCFQLSDGNFIICGSNVIWPTGNSEFANSSSMMAKISQTGDLMWQKNLPVTLCDLWRGISLPDGGFILAGLDNMPENSNIAIARYNNDGGVIKSNQLINRIGTKNSEGNQLSICRLINGNIGMVVIGASQGVVGTSPRLIIFDTELNIISDNIFPSMFSATKNYKNMKIAEGSNGRIYICGTTQEFDTWSWSFIMGVDGTSLDQDFFTERMGGDTNSYPGPFLIGDDGHVIVTSAEQFRAGIYFDIANYFYYHLDEYFSIGTSVSALETDADGNFIARHKYSGFTGYASLTGITKASDGGYLMVGICKIRTDAVIFSPFQILMIKTNSKFEQEWMKQINTTYPAVAVDVKNTDDGGYVIGAYEKSFNKNYKMILIKTDANGSMQ